MTTETKKSTDKAKKPAAKKGKALPNAGAPLEGVDVSGLLKLAKTSLVDPNKPHELTWWPTGCSVFDAVTANGHPGVKGGFPAGRVIELSGEESTGKTTLALQAAANMQKHGKLIVYLDYERSFHEEYAQSLGLDTTPFEEGGLFWLLEPENMEKGHEIMDDLCKDPDLSQRLGMFIVDSVAAQNSGLSKLEQGKKDAYTESEAIGILARQMSKHLPVLQRNIQLTTGCVVLINQVRHNMDPMSRAKWQTPGGKTIKHVCSIRIQLKKGKSGQIKRKAFNPLSGTRDDWKIGHWVSFEVLKNKVTGEFPLAVEIPVVDNLGVDNLLSCIHLGKTLGVVGVSGSYYATAPGWAAAGEVRAMGDLGLRKELIANPEQRDCFVNNIETKLHENFGILHQERQSGRYHLDSTEGESGEEVDEG